MKSLFPDSETELTRSKLARHLSCTRREFLRDAAGLTIGSKLLGGSPYVHGEALQKKRKMIVVTFGGGARDQETFAPEGQENIPHLLNELAPQSSFFTQMLNQGILGHYVATASLIEVWIDETERRAWFLYESCRPPVA